MNEEKQMDPVDLDFDDLDLDEQQQQNHNLRLLRDRAKKVKPLETENQTLKQENHELRFGLALKEAGIDTTSPTGRLFKDAYKGDVTVEKVREAALEYGIIQPSAEQVAEQEKAAGLQRMASVTGSSSTSGAPPSTLSPADYASWSPDVRRAFANDHPREFEALKRGETLPAIPGF